MAKKISRTELCRESLKRIIAKFVDAGSDDKGKCRYCGEVNGHLDKCNFETAGKVTKKVRLHKKGDKSDKN